MLHLKISEEKEEKIIQTTVDILSNGGLVIYPTETCYGVGVDATNPNTVSKLLKYKKRPHGKAISVAVYSKEMADTYVEINSEAEKIYQTFLPGPITVISKSKGKVDKRLESELGTLGIRIPNYRLILEILKLFNKPITATSANSSGAKTPYSIQDVFDSLTKNQTSYIDLILDAGEIPKNPSSTVIDTTTLDLTVYRAGRVDPRVHKAQKYNSNSVDETIEIARKLTREILNLNLDYYLFLLDGEMGAGKTHFTKGIGLELGIQETIKSPSYTYVHEYNLKDGTKMFHLDAWRLQTEEDIESLDLYSWFKNKNIIVVEWPSVITNLNPKFLENYKFILIEFVITDQDKREIRVVKQG